MKTLSPRKALDKLLHLASGEAPNCVNQHTIQTIVDQVRPKRIKPASA
ncbi:hypothetical protein [Hymenobacter metallilatus]|nr:hypothetical protein [Hymenobacter metallilatus]